MRIVDVYTVTQIQSIVKELVHRHGPFVTKDWILSYIEPGDIQAVAMSTMITEYYAHQG